MNYKKKFIVAEVSEKLRMDSKFILHCIQAQWISPSSPKMMELDEEDIARLQLIRDLKEGFGANDEAIPVILHLLDQIYSLRRVIQDLEDQFKQRRTRRSV